MAVTEWQPPAAERTRLGRCRVSGGGSEQVDADTAAMEPEVSGSRPDAAAFSHGYNRSL